MTGKNIFSTLKSKLTLILALLVFISFSAFAFTACSNDDEDDDTSKTYTKQEADEAELKNGSFEYGLINIDASDYPLTTPNDWGSIKTENSSTTSLLTSGVVSTEDQAWSELLNTIYEDDDFMEYAEEAYSFSKSNITQTKTTENPDKTADEIGEIVRDYIFDTYLTCFANPKTHDEAIGSNIYMINNYTKNNWYTAQTVTSSTSITLEKGTYGKISFYAYASNLTGYGNYYLNVRINGSVGSNAQEPYKLYGINNTNGWKQYSIYVKADSFVDTSISVSLGLGYTALKGRIDNNCQGTVYFDDVTYEAVSVEQFNADITSPIPTKAFEYNSDASVAQQAQTNIFNYLYSLVEEESVGYQDYVETLNLTSSVSHEFTKSNTLGSNNQSLTTNHPDKFGAESTGNAVISADGKTLTFEGLKYASYSATISNALFSVQPESYFYLAFNLENNLERLGSTKVSIYVIDQDEEKIVNTYTNIEENDCVKILVKNNELTGSAKAFKILIIVGPTDIKSTNFMNDFASGSVILTDFVYATGLSYQFEKDELGNVKLENNQKNETSNYNLYSMIASSAKEIALDEKTSNSNDTYFLSSSESAVGQANYTVSNVKGYTGISYDHTYVNTESSNNNINERSGKQGDGNGNYAGLINSKALTDYQGLAIKDQIISNLNYNGEKSIQPIMIYNGSADSYGFIGESLTIQKSAYAKISVKVRATDAAKAYIYLVDTSDYTKPVATFGFNKGNVENDITFNKSFSKKLAFEGINKDLMGTGGWLTLTFYIATGANEMNLRLELWNGSRDGAEKSQGFVFFAFDAFTSTETFTPSTLSAAFTEPTNSVDAYTVSGNPLYDTAFTNGVGRQLIDNAVKYERELDATERQFNSEDHDSTVNYEANYVWAENLSSDCGMIYAIYNTINPVAVDPYASEETDESEDTGCTAETDSSTFWLSFSSIVLAAVLVLAIIMLIVKTYRRKRAAKVKDATSHYKVTSRYKVSEDLKKKAEKEKKKASANKYEDDEELDIAESVEETSEEPISEKETEETSEEVNEEYVYGDVQNFGEETKETEQTTDEQQSSENN